jgi:SAM-dependent methyltransferase
MSETDETLDFYKNTVQKLVEQNNFCTDAPTLVLAAGNNDYKVMRALEFSNVTFSNVDPRLSEEDFAPYHLTYYDAQNIAAPDNSFAQIIIANALHHCRSPHRALVEMYRVAGRGILCFENRDSALIRLAARFGMAQQYECEAVYGNAMKFGGVDNSAIPNYVYRWTEREIHKTVSTFAPEVKPYINYFYGLRTPAYRLTKMNSPIKAYAALGAMWGVRMITTLFPSQSNLFAFFVMKSRENWPWIRNDGENYQFNETWARQRFENENVQRQVN